VLHGLGAVRRWQGKLDEARQALDEACDCALREWMRAIFAESAYLLALRRELDLARSRLDRALEAPAFTHRGDVATR
jgi:hypothetical protein